MKEKQSWSSWLGITTEKLKWTIEYLAINGKSIDCHASETLGKEHVVRTLDKLDENAEGRELTKRMKSTYDTQRRRRKKRAEGYVYITLAMSKDSKAKLKKLKETFECSNLEDTLEELIERGSNLRDEMETIYRREIDGLKKRKRIRNIIAAKHPKETQPYDETIKQVNALKDQISKLTTKVEELSNPTQQTGEEQSQEAQNQGSES